MERMDEVVKFFLIGMLTLSGLEASHVKETIKELQGNVENYQKLAELYLEDQNLEASIETFLALLEGSKSEGKGETDSKVYLEALDLYLNGGKPVETAQELIGKYKDQSEDVGVAFLLAGAYANLRDYTMFYQTFLPAFEKAPNHYLAHKMRAALHIKLYERSKSEEIKNIQKKQIVAHATHAAKEFPEDASLYVWMISFCDKNDKTQCVGVAINQFLQQERAISRNDIPFFVQEAINTKQFDLAQRFINKTKEWFQYSRLIQAAQKHLDDERSKSSYLH